MGDGIEAKLEAAVVHHRAGAHSEAERLYRDVLAREPGNADALHLLGLLHSQRGEYATAVEYIERAIAAAPAALGYHYNLGNARRELGRRDEALAAFRREIELNPGFAKAHHNLGNLLAGCGDDAAAISAFRSALQSNPGAAATWSSLAGALERLSRLPEALQAHERALSLEPDSPNLLVNCAATLMAAGDHAAAERHLRRALELDPASLNALQNLAILETGRGRFAEAFASFDRARQIAPENVDIYRNILPAVVYHPEFDNAQRFAEHRRFGRAASGQMDASLPPAFANSRDPERPLRIGWISSDFREHPVGGNLAPFFAYRDRRAFQAICYSDVARPDAETARFTEQSDGWRATRSLSDRDVARHIREDGIDILVIAAGRFDDNRPTIAVHRAAPIQINLFDVASLGIAEIDYCIGDAVLVPRHADERFAERALRLPNFYTHAAIENAPCDLRPHEGIVFGSFSNPSKINRSVLDLWAKLLGRVPRSMLMLKYKDEYASADRRKDIVAAFAERGIGADRLNLIFGHTGLRDHLAFYNQVDIALDTFPFAGSTTSFEALWMGVPVVSLIGDHVVARWTAAMLQKIGLTELIGESPERYLAIATSLAEDAPRRAAMRAVLRERVASSSLCDGRRAARYFERVLRAVWRHWCVQP